MICGGFAQGRVLRLQALSTSASSSTQEMVGFRTPCLSYTRKSCCCIVPNTMQAVCSVTMALDRDSMWKKLTVVDHTPFVPAVKTTDSCATCYQIRHFSAGDPSVKVYLIPPRCNCEGNVSRDWCGEHFSRLLKCCRVVAGSPE